MSDINAFPWLFSKRKPVFSPQPTKPVPMLVTYADANGNVYVDGLNRAYVNGTGQGQPYALTLVRFD